MGSTMITPLYALYSSAFHFSEAVLTFIYATYVVGTIAALLFFGKLSDEAGRRRVSVFALALCIAAALLFLFAGSTLWLFLARLLSGLAVGLASGTGTAWLADQYDQRQRRNATQAATYSNLAGAAIGPIFAGAIAQYVSAPLRLPFIIYIGILLGVSAAVLFTPETVSKLKRLRDVSLRPQIAVPKEIRAQFITPAITAFVIWSLAGFYFALLPSVLRHDLHLPNLAVAGAVVFEMSVAAIIGVAVTTRVASSTAMVSGLVLIVPSVIVLVAAQAFTSMPLVLLGSAIAGVALGAGYRGSLQVVNEIAPADRRAAVISAYFIACFIGNSIPVISVGLLTQFVNGLVASAVFAAVIAVFALSAVILRYRKTPSTLRSATLPFKAMQD